VTILVVLRDADVRALIKEMLKRPGDEVIGVASDAQAADLVSPSAVDLLFAEVAPELDGRAIAERLRTQRPGLPVVYVTRYDDVVIDSEGEAILAEPFSRHDLANAVSAVLEGGL
jgi:CheY-like chemotaxis protein